VADVSDSCKPIVRAGPAHPFLISPNGRYWPLRSAPTRIYRWFGTVEFIEALRSYAPAESKEQRLSNIRSALQSVSQQLRNTVAVCKKAYVHPGVLEAYADGALMLGAPSVNGKTGHGLTSIERLTLRLLPRARRRQSSLPTRLRRSARERAVRRHGAENAAAPA